MPTPSRLTALALARAMLAGRPSTAGLAARIKACLGADTAWALPLAQRCARLPGEHWRRLTPRTLASLIERDGDYRLAGSAGGSAGPPKVRRYILREQTGMQPLPLGLDHCQLPQLPQVPHTAVLADWLGIPAAGLWRLTRAADWQRRSELGEQHYRYQLLAKRSGGWRLLEVPHPYLMPLQRWVLDGLLDRIPPHEAACAYTRERSVLDHARAHAGQAVVLKFDLRDFFTSVRASKVHALFTTLGYADSVARELTALCTTATPEAVLQRLQVGGHVVVNQRPNLPRPEFDRLKAILHRCATDGPAAQNRDQHPHWRSHLQGRVAWAAQLNPAKALRLQRLLDRIDWQR